MVKKIEYSKKFLDTGLDFENLLKTNDHQEVFNNQNKYIIEIH